MKSYLAEQAERASNGAVEKNSRRNEWPVYEEYKVVRDAAGGAFVVAPETAGVEKVLRPLSRVSADLFLRFGGWVESRGMDKDLGSAANAAAAVAWANEHGVLGLNASDTSLLELVNSRRVTADHLEQPWRGDVVVGRRNSARGGRPRESVENFAFAAWEAYIVLRLYESVRSREVVNVDAIARFMSPLDQAEDFPEPPGFVRDSDQENSPEPSWVERDVHSRDPRLARRWALTVVEDAVNRHIEDHCYPTVQGAPGSQRAPGLYEQGWGFRSLLGAMWLQMMFLMRADRRCLNCGRAIDPGRRKDAKFCGNNGLCRSEWNYREGKGKSSKEQRRQARYVR